MTDLKPCLSKKHLILTDHNVIFGLAWFPSREPKGKEHVGKGFGGCEQGKHDPVHHPSHVPKQKLIRIHNRLNYQLMYQKIGCRGII